MLYVDKNNNIRLTRGDTAKFVVSVQNESIREPYDILSSIPAPTGSTRWSATTPHRQTGHRTLYRLCTPSST